MLKQTSKNPVQDALDLVKKYDRSNKFNVVASRGDVQHENKKKSLEKKLLSSKQQVVQHLRISRSIERSILQTEIVEKAIKAQLLNRVEKDSAGKVAGRIKDAHRRAGSSASQSWLDKKELFLIESIYDLELGHAGVVQSTLNRYDDSKLCLELAGMPESTKAKMSAAFFAKIASMVSTLRITQLDALWMYEQAMVVVQRKQDESQDLDASKVKWGILSNMLRCKLLVLELAKALMLAVPALPYGPSLSSISTTSSLALMQQKTNSSGSADLEGNSVSSWEWDHGTQGNVSASKSATKEKSNSLSHAEAKSPSKKYASLKGKYDESQSRQLELSDQIISNLSKISKSVHIDEAEHGAAMKFAKKVAIRKLEQVLLNVVRRALKATWEKWCGEVKFYRYQVCTVKSLKAFATYQLFDFLEKSFNTKLSRGMKRLKKRIEWFQDMEQVAAIAELQRYWRGCLCRRRKNHAQRNAAARQIQRIARGRQGRAYAIRYAEHKHLRSHVIMIERAYLKYRWKRIRKNVRVFKIQKRMTERIQRVFRGHRGRKKVRRLRNQLGAIASAIKIQNVWRRYKAIVFVDKKLRARIRFRASAKMQAMVRGAQSRVRSKVLLIRYRLARRIQCLIRSFSARRRVQRLRRARAALRIQRVVRGRRGRKRYAYVLKRKLNFLQMRRDAIKALQPLLIGHFTRKKWVPILSTYMSRRKRGATGIQCFVRKCFALRRVAKLREDRDNVELQLRLAEEARQVQIRKENETAGAIQRIVRGFLGRRKAARRQAEVEAYLAIKNARVPAYYRLREEYYRSQNTYHRPFLIRIQCAYRCRLARGKALTRRRKVAVKRIEAKWLSYTQIRDAKIYVGKYREVRRLQNAAAVQVQRITRGFMGRYEARKHEHAEIFKWFIEEVHSLGMIGRALQNFRVRKRTQEKINRQMTKAQALVRKFLTRCKFLRGYKRLVRERDARRKKRRVRACTSIQGFARIIKAQHAVIKRKAIIAEERRLAGEMEELDNRIDGIHADWTNDLLAIRIETQVRGTLGKQAAEKKEVEVKASVAKLEADKRAKAATRIQALARGVQRRKTLKPQLSALRAERQKRSFCVECEANVAVKRCRNCKDRYCDACFLLIHRKGARRHHSWEPIHADTMSAAFSQSDANPGQTSKRRQGRQTINEKASNSKTAANTTKENAQSAAKGGKREWQKFYDDAARAHYWFSEVTGEARWTDPTLD